MKLKQYAPLLISLGLAFSSAGTYAKPTHHSVKKHTVHSAKKGKAVVRKHKTQWVKHRQKIVQEPAVVDASSPSIRSYPISTTTHPPQEFAPFGHSRIHSVISRNSPYSLSDRSEVVESPMHYLSAYGVIESSFTRAAHEAGLSDELIVELSKIFAWDIDFATNLRSGDRFTVLYNNSDHGYAENHSTQIIAAEFMTRGKIFTAVRYKDHNGIVGYYSPNGKGMHKAFLSTPVDFARVSSHFDSHRKHPILNRIRAHKGVDYAARTGTPVKSAGDGIVTFLGRKGGYGQVLIVQHGDHYETLYAHLSGFKKGLHSGDTVRQGEVVGYVGQTGLATGPHLHYEFRIDGVHHNPETIDHDHTMPLDQTQLAEFKVQTQPLLAQMYRAKANSLLAKISNNAN